MDDTKDIPQPHFDPEFFEWARRPMFEQSSTTIVVLVPRRWVTKHMVWVLNRLPEWGPVKKFRDMFYRPYATFNGCYAKRVTHEDQAP